MNFHNIMTNASERFGWFMLVHVVRPWAALWILGPLLLLFAWCVVPLVRLKINVLVKPRYDWVAKFWWAPGWFSIGLIGAGLTLLVIPLLNPNMSPSWKGWAWFGATSKSLPTSLGAVTFLAGGGILFAVLGLVGFFSARVGDYRMRYRAWRRREGLYYRDWRWPWSERVVRPNITGAEFEPDRRERLSPGISVRPILARTSRATPIWVPFKEKDEAKILGARWDPGGKTWYVPEGVPTAPFERWLGGPKSTKPQATVPGSNRKLGPIIRKNRIGLDLIPESAWFSNARQFLDEKTWTVIKKRVYARHKYRCECCDGQGLKHPVECHERWNWDEVKKIQSLVGFSALCPACHEVCHFGLARVKRRDGIALQHLRAVNDWAHDEAQLHIDKSFEEWERRSDIEWSIDLTLLGEMGIPLPVIDAARPKRMQAVTPSSGRGSRGMPWE